MDEAQLVVDPRVERSRRVILQATLDELAARGYGSLTIESVARRAGVGKATVYRHWRDKFELIADAFETLKRPLAPPTDGPARERIVALLEALIEAIHDSSWSMCMPALIEAAARDEAVAHFHHQFVVARRQVLVDLIVEGLETGEFASDLDPVLLAELLAGPIFYRRLMTGEPFPRACARRVVDVVLPPST